MASVSAWHTALKRRRPPAPAICPSRPRAQARQRRAGQYQHVRTVGVDRLLAQRAQGGLVITCTASMRARGWSSERMPTSRPFQAVGAHDLAIPGLDATRDRDDGKALAQQAGASQRRSVRPTTGTGITSRSVAQAGVPESRDDDGVDAPRDVRPPSWAVAYAPIIASKRVSM